MCNFLGFLLKIHIFIRKVLLKLLDFNSFLGDNVCSLLYDSIDKKNKKKGGDFNGEA